MNLLERINEFYYEKFITNPKPQEYLSSIGITKPEIYQAFKIGFADGSLLKTLPKGGKMVDELKSLGVLTKEGSEYFTDCITFPLYDVHGNIVGVYGRKKFESQKVKHCYLVGKRGVFNSQAAAGFNEIILTDAVIDSLILYQNGFFNAIPLTDNNLTADHLDLFREYRPQLIYLCLTNSDGEKVNETLKQHGFKVSIIQLPDKDNLYNFFKSGKDFSQLLVNPETTEEFPIGYNVTQAETGLFITCQEREYRVKGISMYNLERLKVNIRASFHGKYHIDSIDLYQSKARRYFSAQLMKLFELEQEAINADLFFIIEQVEKYQVKQTEVKEGKKIYQMTKSEEAEAIDLLKSPDLLNKIVYDMDCLGYVGEESNKILAYLIAISRKQLRPLSGIVISQSSAGKSGLIEAVQDLTPPEDVFFFSRISPQALYYMDKDGLKNKLLIIEERIGAEQADYSIRTLQSRQQLSMGLPVRDASSGKIKTVTFEVEGPIAFLESTTSSDINHENLTRNFEIYLDESAEQTKRIHRAQREAKTEIGLSKKSVIESIKLQHQNLQRALKPVLVEIPFATLLDFPIDSLRTRRDHERFLSLVECITFLFQYQREQKEIIISKGERLTCVVSTLDDYATAYELAKEVLGSSLDELKKYARSLLELIKDLVQQKIQDTGECTFTRREIREFTGWPDYQIKNYIWQLEDMEYLIIQKVKERGQFEYSLNNPDDRRPLKGLLTPSELEKLLLLKKTS